MRAAQKKNILRHRRRLQKRETRLICVINLSTK